MSSFTSPLIVEFIDGTKWKLLEPFEYHVGEVGSDIVIDVPLGFETDFASIPRIFWTLIGSPTEKYGKAAVIHDYLYSCRGSIPGFLFKRKECDEIFLEAMEVLGVGRTKRYLMYWAVRVGGRHAWSN